jgi:hypothetical protein
MANYDPFFTPMQDLYASANEAILRALRLINQDFPNHPASKVEAFVKRAWSQVNMPGTIQHSFIPEEVALSYRAAHPGEQPAPPPLARASKPASTNGSDDLIYDFD